MQACPLQEYDRFPTALDRGIRRRSMPDTTAANAKNRTGNKKANPQDRLGRDIQTKKNSVHAKEACTADEEKEEDTIKHPILTIGHIFLSPSGLPPKQGALPSARRSR